MYYPLQKKIPFLEVESGRVHYFFGQFSMCVIAFDFDSSRFDVRPGLFSKETAGGESIMAQSVFCPCFYLMCTRFIHSGRARRRIECRHCCVDIFLCDRNFLHVPAVSKSSHHQKTSSGILKRFLLFNNNTCFHHRMNRADIFICSGSIKSKIEYLTRMERLGF